MWATERKDKERGVRQSRVRGTEVGKCIKAEPFMASPACSTGHMLACPGIREYDQSKQQQQQREIDKDSRQLPLGWLVTHDCRRNIANYL
jgi:hypothetical protein